MGRQRAVLQPARHPDPAHAIRMKRKRPSAAQRFGPMSLMNIGYRIGRNIFLVIGVVETSPFFLLLVPPHQLLAFAPWLAVRPGRRAVIDDPAVVRPRKSPAMPQQVFRVTLVSPVVTFFRIHAAVNPRAASSGPVIFQVADMCDLLAIGNRIPVDFLQYGFRVGFSGWAFYRIIPGQRPQAIVAGPRITSGFFLYAPPQVIHEPQFAASIPGRLNRLVPELQQALCVSEGAFLFRRTSRWEQEDFGSDGFWR